MRALSIAILGLSVLLSGCADRTNEAGAVREESAHQAKRRDPGESVRIAFEKIRAKEGKYFDHVFRILETDGGVPALIATLDSTHADDSFQAWVILSRISQRSGRHKADEEPQDKAHWEKWWTDTGHAMPVDTLKGNFDSHWK
ncbi:hypothetical protein LCGC14_1625330 [marine sediment metagenome]|uniref:Lipoprotein n=1 Tax=marine sediment metagenome TaxID=412755 RepID=A0A0F9I4G1_9ZZZZ